MLLLLLLCSLATLARDLDNHSANCFLVWKAASLEDSFTFFWQQLDEPSPMMDSYIVR